MTIDEVLDKIGITPGPWTVESDRYRFVKSGDHYVASLWPYSERSFPERHRCIVPTARAIVASREMLKALIGIAQDIERGEETVYAACKHAVFLAIEHATGRPWSEIKKMLEETRSPDDRRVIGKENMP